MPRETLKWLWFTTTEVTLFDQNWTNFALESRKLVKLLIIRSEVRFTLFIKVLIISLDKISQSIVTWTNYWFCIFPSNIDPRDYKPKNGDSSHKSNTGSDALRSDKQRGISVAPLTLSGSQQASPFAASKSSPQNERTVKLLLGEMYEDKEFLEDLLHDRDFTNNPNEAVRQLVFEGLKYLEARTEFWRQQKPLYARKKDSVRPKTHKSDEHGKKAESEAEKEREMLVKEAQKKKYTFKTTEEAEQWVQVHWSAIHRAHEIGNYEKTLRLCKTFLYDLGGSSKVAAKSANESLQLIPNKVRQSSLKHSCFVRSLYFAISMRP